MNRYQGDQRRSRPIRFRDVLDRRDRLLKETEWTQLPGSGLSPLQRAAWEDYRARLWAIRPDPRETAGGRAPLFPDWPGEARLRALRLAEERPASINYEIDWRML